MAINVAEYISQLAQTAGLDEADKAVLLKAAGNEKFAKGLEADVLRQADYSRNMDQLAVDKKKSADYYAELLQWNAAKKAEYDELLASGRSPAAAAAVTGFTAEEAKKLLTEENAKRDANMIGLFKTGLKLQGQHMTEFREPLDIDGVVKLAQDKSLSFEQAYNEMIGPRRTAMSAESLKTQLDARYAEGARDALSKHHIPTNATPPEYRVLLDRDPQKQVGAGEYVLNSGVKTPEMERQLKENFAAAWNTAQGTTSSTT